MRPRPAALPSENSAIWRSVTTSPAGAEPPPSSAAAAAAASRAVRAARFTSAISRASNVSSTQMPTSAADVGAMPAGADTAGSASMPAPTVLPALGKQRGHVQVGMRAAGGLACICRSAAPAPCRPGVQAHTRKSSGAATRAAGRQRGAPVIREMAPHSVPAGGACLAAWPALPLLGVAAAAAAGATSSPADAAAAARTTTAPCCLPWRL